MRILREFSGLGSRPYPIDHERRRRVMIALAEQDMTISSLSRNISLSKSIISRVINGRRISPKTEQRIAEFLDKPADYLFPKRKAREIKKMRHAEAAQAKAKGKPA